MSLSLPVESVRERDIDFLLVEEFLSSPEFVSFFNSALGLPSCDTLTKVERSINDFGIGETDVLVEYRSGHQNIGILIENKLDALFQPQQAERYLLRAKEHEGRKTYDKTYVVLVAPAQYIQRQTDFSLCISYEQIMEYFQHSNLGARGDFKIQLLKIAAEKLRRGYVAINSEPNQAFWYSYREQLAVDAPSVSMKPVSAVPANSDWIDLSVGPHKLVHKLAKGYLDVATPAPGYRQKIDAAFSERVEHLTFKSGDVVRIHTTPMERLKPFADQLDQFEQYVKDLHTLLSLL